MKRITVRGRFGTSRILVGKSLAELPRLVDLDRAIAVVDANAYRHHRSALPRIRPILIRGGESAKTLDTVRRIDRELLKRGADRSSFLLGIGGGVVCDIAGFVASTYMRGLKFGFVSTTLLSQVDASTGGKNGVNLDGAKNIVGVINQPEFVLCDPRFLRTLPAREVRNGFAEVIKHGAIGAPALLNVLEKESVKAKSLDSGLMARIVAASIRVKAAIVGRDERENGERKHLNFGHTLAHAMEKAYAVPHGQAVAVGMVFALRLSLKKGILKNPRVIERLERLLGLYGLPVALNKDPRPVLAAMAQDKKKSGRDVDFVFLRDIGDPCVRPIPLRTLMEDGFDLCQPA